MAEIKATGDRLLVEPIAPPQESVGGVILPEVEQRRPKQAAVLDVGPKVEGDYKDGDVILYGQYAGQEIEVEHEAGMVELLVLAENDILAVLR